VEHADRRCRRRLDDRPIIREAGCSRRAAIRSYGHHNVMIFLAPRACVTSEADPGDEDFWNFTKSCSTNERGQGASHGVMRSSSGAARKKDVEPNGQLVG
jgi:hypothetical protein